jgi:hypothetical protein
VKSRKESSGCSTQKDLLRRQIAQRQREEEEAELLKEAKRFHDEMRQISLQKTTEERRLDRTMEEHREGRRRVRRDASKTIAMGMPLTKPIIDH